MAKQFVWLLADQTPRSGPGLKKGVPHNVVDYPSHVVEWWVESGAAKYTDDKPKPKKGGGE